MAVIKISQLPVITVINSNVANTLLVGVDVPTSVTGQFTVGTLAKGLYSNTTLDVGVNPNTLPNTIAQFALGGESYIQTNLVNTNDGGTADMVVTANAGSGGTDSANFIDMGWANKNYAPGSEFNNIGTAVRPNDGYLYAQGTSGQPYGNLIIGTTTAGANLKFIVGGGSAQNVVARMTSTGLVLNTQSSITFADGSKQSSAAADVNYVAAAFAKANSAVQNTAVIQLQSLILSGSLIANSVGQGISVDTFTSNNGTFSKNVVVLGNLSANGLLGNIFFSNVVTTTTQSNSILWSAQAGAITQQTAQLWYYSNTQSLILDTDIPGDRLSISKVLFFRGFNNTGAPIPSGSFVRLAPGVTANQIPYIALADSTSSANATVAGLVKVTIAAGAYGFAYSQGIVEDFNSTGLGQNGDILFLSATPGVASNVAPTGSNTVVQLGRIITSDATLGKVYVQNQLRQAYGRTNGSALYAYANNIVSSNTLSINDATGTVNVSNILFVGNQINTPGSNTLTIAPGGTGSLNVSSTTPVNIANNLTVSGTISGNAVPSTLSYVGTWTPSLNVSPAQGTQTYNNQNGTFVKTGRHVFATFSIALNTQTATTSGIGIDLTGLPTPAAVPNGSAGALFINTQTIANPITNLSGNVSSSNTSVGVYGQYITSGGGGSVTYRQLNGTDLGSTPFLTGTIEYISAN
jgi:hypothetical protein